MVYLFKRGIELIVAGCVISGCDNLASHTFEGKRLCCECYEKAVSGAINITTMRACMNKVCENHDGDNCKLENIVVNSLGECMECKGRYY